MLSLYEPPLRAKTTARQMRHVFGLVEAWATSSDDLTTDRIAAWAAARAKVVGVNTLIGELGYVRAICSFAVEEGMLGRHPFNSRRLRVRPEPPAGKTHHSLAEIARVLGHLERESAAWKGGRLYAAASTVAYTGLRRSEALYLRLEDLDLAAGLLWVTPTKERRLKTEASAQPVPVPEGLAEVLKAWTPRVTPGTWLFPTVRRSGAWANGSCGSRPVDALKAAGRAVGVEGLTWLSLRHSWATHAETAWGLPEAGIQRVLRHTTPLTQRHYRHADAENLRGLASAVRFPSEPRP